MEKSITHFRLWQILVNDKVYGKKHFAEELCHDFAFHVKVTFEGQQILEFGVGDEQIQVELLFCQDYGEVFKEMRELQDDFDSILPDEENDPPSDQVPGLWQEIFLTLATKHGLPFRNIPKKLNPASDPFTIEILQVASPKVFREQDVKDYLLSNELPLPAELFPEHKPNTEQLRRSMPEDHIWDMEYSLANVREFLRTWEEEESQAKIQLKEKTVIFSYEGTSVEVKRKQGHIFLNHLVKNPNQEFHCRKLYELLGTVGNRYADPDTNDMDVEQHMHTADGRVRNETFNRISYLKEKLEDSLTDTKRSEIEDEIEKLHKYLRENFDSSGRPRTIRTPDENKCRKNVCNSIMNALSELSIKHHSLYEQLYKAIKFGYTLQYNSPPGIKF